MKQRIGISCLGHRTMRHVQYKQICTTVSVTNMDMLNGIMTNQINSLYIYINYISVFTNKSGIYII